MPVNEESFINKNKSSSQEKAILTPPEMSNTKSDEIVFDMNLQNIKESLDKIPQHIKYLKGIEPELEM